MDNITINISEYLPEAEIAQIARDEVAASIQRALKEEGHAHRIISNSCYEMVWEKVDEAMDGKLKESMVQQVTKIVNDLTGFTVFRKPDAWNREPNNMYKFLCECLEGNKELIREKVKEAVDSQVHDAAMRELKTDVQELVYDIINKKLNN